MKLNIDDTFEEQYINSMHKATDVMINCEHCSRLFYMDDKIALDRLDHNIPLLCARCRKEIYDYKSQSVNSVILANLPPNSHGNVLRVKLLG